MVTLNEQAIAEKIAEVMGLLGIKFTEGNKDTPNRVAKMYCRELFRNRDGDTSELDRRVKTFDNPNGANLITVCDIKFSSTCEHHWLPFFGVCHIGYVPRDRVLGLSKLPRIVEHFSKKPQLQERLTSEIMDYIIRAVSPLCFFIRIEARHTCVMCRGIENDCATVTENSYRYDLCNVDSFNRWKESFNDRIDARRTVL